MKTVRLQKHTPWTHLQSATQPNEKTKTLFSLTSIAIEYFCVFIINPNSKTILPEYGKLQIFLLIFLLSIRLLGQKVEQLFVFHVLQGVHVDSQRLRHAAHVQAERLQQLDKIEFFP